MLKYLQRKREEGFPFRHDQEILQELGILLRDWNQRTRNSIASDCQFGRVVLQGTVTRIEHKEEVGLLATKTLGVLDVSNQVVVRAS
jgi:osmotically-inducible protein OsmY